MNILLQQHPTFFPHHHNSPRRSPSISPTHLSPRMSARKRKADDDLDPRSLDEDMSVSPLSSPAISSRNIARPSKKIRNNEVIGRPLALPRLLETLDADSLRNVLQTICERHPEIGQEVVTSAPRPSVASTLGVLEQYQERLRQAFPFGGNTGNDYAYNRVRVQLGQLIDAITDFVPHYLPPNETQVTTSLDFLDSVTNIVHQLPDWESSSHNHHKDNAYDEISRAWARVISEASKRGGGIQLHNGEWDQKLQKHNAMSGGQMQAAVNALGSNLYCGGAGGPSNSNMNSSNDPNSIRNQLFSGTYGTNLPYLVTGVQYRRRRFAVVGYSVVGAVCYWSITCTGFEVGAMVEGKGYHGGRPSAGVVPYGRIFIARIEDILQEDVMWPRGKESIISHYRALCWICVTFRGGKADKADAVEIKRGTYWCLAIAPLRPSLPKSKTHQLRAMASAAAPQKCHWLVIVPDQPGKLEARMAVRSDHLKNVTPKVDEGFWKVGGATLDEPPRDGEALKINGSCFIAHATTKEEVMVELKNDVYAKGEVWDFEKIQILPFKPAFIKS
ncbi:hypothetical protein V500_05486 [Pseudogymnoascus sp. VKM F-4518 (FW-2643)]|nr:hypothetical protein V500_05486 [Pseudogymnoascus sp. VKM F-4518 (FW-2643)]